MVAPNGGRVHELRMVSEPQRPEWLAGQIEELDERVAENIAAIRTDVAAIRVALEASQADSRKKLWALVVAIFLLSMNILVAIIYFVVGIR